MSFRLKPAGLSHFKLPDANINVALIDAITLELELEPFVLFFSSEG